MQVNDDDDDLYKVKGRQRSNVVNVPLLPTAAQYKPKSHFFLEIISR